MGFPFAYHITFGTYGTRLHGDERGTVLREHNRYGEPICEHKPALEWIERQLLRFAPVWLTDDQRRFVETSVPEICLRGGWSFHMCAGQKDHVHTLLSAPVEGKAIRRWLKRWLGEALSHRWPLPAEQSWWAEGGSVKWIFDEEYFHAARRYIERQRISREARDGGSV